MAIRFIVTNELGRLARWLRLLGYDTIYFRRSNYGKLTIQALRENRIIITRQKEVSEAVKKITIIIQSEDLVQQIRQIKQTLNLELDKGKMFTRCPVCNSSLTAVKKQTVKDQIPPYVYQHQDAFLQCPNCKHLYWPGTHWGNIQEVIYKCLK